MVNIWIVFTVHLKKWCCLPLIFIYLFNVLSVFGQWCPSVPPAPVCLDSPLLKIKTGLMCKLWWWKKVLSRLFMNDMFILQQTQTEAKTEKYFAQCLKFKKFKEQSGSSYVSSNCFATLLSKHNIFRASNTNDRRIHHFLRFVTIPLKRGTRKIVTFQSKVDMTRKFGEKLWIKPTENLKIWAKRSVESFPAHNICMIQCHF